MSMNIVWEGCTSHLAVHAYNRATTLGCPIHAQHGWESRLFAGEWAGPLGSLGEHFYPLQVGRGCVFSLGVGEPGGGFRGGGVFAGGGAFGGVGLGQGFTRKNTT